MARKISQATTLVIIANAASPLIKAIGIHHSIEGRNFTLLLQRGFLPHLVHFVFFKEKLLYIDAPLWLGSLIILNASQAHSALACAAALSSASFCLDGLQELEDSLRLQTIAPVAKLTSPHFSHFQLA